MRLLEEICRCHSVAFAGLAKNAGKTECLNYVLRQARNSAHTLALTSIGVDGESRDQVLETRKPEITLYPGMLFTTSEAHYLRRRLTSEIIEVSDSRTALGRLVTARAVTPGNVILSGPADTASMRRLSLRLRQLGAETVLIDGALSRLSLSAPEVSDALILSTGAALSPNIPRIVRQTRYVYDLISLPQIPEPLAAELAQVSQGIRTVDSEGNVHDPGIVSAYMLDSHRDKLFSHGTTIYVAGAVSEKLMKFLASQREAASIRLIMRDFTRMFADPATYYTFLRKGGSVAVLHSARLLAITVNPLSPQGYSVDADLLTKALQEQVDVPVIDVMKEQGLSPRSILD